MMNDLELQLFDATLRREPVLSVYLALAASRSAWSLDLEHAIERTRNTLAAAPHNERERFEAASRQAERAVSSIPAGSAGATWIAFVMPTGVRHSEITPIPLPTLVAWSEGIRLAPYLRVLDANVPVVMVVADNAHLDLWEYRDAQCRLVERIHARPSANHEAAHLSGAPPKTGFHTGTRGGVARDEWQRQRREATSRMLDVGATRVRQLAGEAGWVGVGGIQNVARRFARILAVPGRVQLAAIDVHATVAMLTAAARDVARSMGERRDAVSVRETIEKAAPSGYGVLGPDDTLKALERGRVKELYVSERFLRERMEEAELGVRHARRQAARVVVLTGRSATSLDEQGGVAARLRYRMDDSAPVRTA